MLLLISPEDGSRTGHRNPALLTHSDDGRSPKEEVKFLHFALAQ